MAIFGIFGKKKASQEEVEQKDLALEEGLKKTKTSIFSKITYAIAGKSIVDDDVLDSIEEALITSDVGVDTTL